MGTSEFRISKSNTVWTKRQQHRMNLWSTTQLLTVVTPQPWLLTAKTTVTKRGLLFVLPPTRRLLPFLQHSSYIRRCKPSHVLVKSLEKWLSRAFSFFFCCCCETGSQTLLEGPPPPFHNQFHCCRFITFFTLIAIPKS